MKVNIHEDPQVQKNITAYKKIFFKWLQDGEMLTEKEIKESQDLLLQLNSDFLFVTIPNKKLSIMEIEIMKDDELSDDVRNALVFYRNLLDEDLLKDEDEEESEEIIIAEAVLQTALAMQDDDLNIWFPDASLCQDYYKTFGVKPHKESVLLARVTKY